jgi:hypothetical protein
MDPSFFDFVNLALCTAINRICGKERAEEIFKEAEEVMFSLIRSNVVGENPITTLKNIARYLERSGYMERIEIKETDEGLQLDMYGVSVLRSSDKLVRSGMAPSHIMTNIMFAALREAGIEAELRELEIDVDKGHVREMWIFKKD